MMGAPPRRLEREMMDDPCVDAGQLESGLADLRHANRWLGGTPIVLSRMKRLVALVRERPVRVLDVATGSADLPMELVWWCHARGIGIEVLATDFHERTLQLARARAAGEPAIRVARADARALPLPAGAVHIAMCCTALHHFDDPAAVRVLSEMRRVSSVGVLVFDLRRSRAGIAALEILARTVWRHHKVTRHDGPASARAAFTPEELRELGARAGLDGARVRRHPPFRQTLEYRVPSARPT